MPKFLENILKSEASSKGFTGRQAARYVYGAMNNLGYMRGNVETTQGARIQAKHVRDVKAGRAQSQHPHKNLGRYLQRSKKTPF